VLAQDLSELPDGEEPAALGEDGEERWSMALLPAVHAFLQYGELKKEGEECVKQLLELL